MDDGSETVASVGKPVVIADHAQRAAHADVQAFCEALEKGNRSSTN